MFTQTDKHFDKLFQKYNRPITVLNLVKKESAKESQLGILLDKYIERSILQDKRYLNNSEDLSYKWIDLLKIYNLDEEELVLNLQKFGSKMYSKNGINVFDFQKEVKNANVNFFIFFLYKISFS